MYQQTVANSPEALVDVIAQFASTAGWTVDRNNLVGSVRTATLHNSGTYIHLWNDADELFIRSSAGYDSGAAGSGQPDQSSSTAAIDLGAGPYPSVYLFAADEPSEHVYAVVEKAAGIYRHMGFGELVKLGSWTGGTFFDGTRPSSSSADKDNPWDLRNHPMFSGFDYLGGMNERGGVHCDVDSRVNYFAPFASTSLTSAPVAQGTSLGATRDGFYNFSINSWSGITPLMPIRVRVERASGFYSDIGDVPAVRFLNMSRFQPAEEFVIGTDTWKVFPWWRQGFVNDQEYSEQTAFAYLKQE